MRVILIVFAILLVLLTFLGAFGGSIYQKEPFFSTNAPDLTTTESEVAYRSEPYQNMDSMESAEDDSMEANEEFYNVPSSTPMVLEEQPKRFLEDGFNIEPFEDEEPTSSLPAMY